MAAESTGPGSLAEHGRGLCSAVGIDRLMMMMMMMVMMMMMMMMMYIKSMEKK